MILKQDFMIIVGCSIFMIIKVPKLFKLIWNARESDFLPCGWYTPQSTYRVGVGGRTPVGQNDKLWIQLNNWHFFKVETWNSHFRYSFTFVSSLMCEVFSSFYQFWKSSWYFSILLTFPWWRWWRWSSMAEPFSALGAVWERSNKSQNLNLSHLEMYF